MFVQRISSAQNIIAVSVSVSECFLPLVIIFTLPLLLPSIPRKWEVPIYLNEEETISPYKYKGARPP